MMFLMGVQRVFAGAHWPTDAAAGWLWGGLTLFVLIQVYTTLSSRVRVASGPRPDPSLRGEGLSVPSKG
jgi:membrane-associated phospholipid phosphatase